MQALFCSISFYFNNLEDFEQTLSKYLPTQNPVGPNNLFSPADTGI